MSSTKADKRLRIVEKATVWKKLYQEKDKLGVDQVPYLEACRYLVAAVSTLIDHDKEQLTKDAKLFHIMVGGKKIVRARCLYCGSEVSPKGFASHYKNKRCETQRKEYLRGK